LTYQDAEAKNKYEATLEKAKKEIDQFYEEYNEKKSKQVGRNRYFLISLYAWTLN
jgi:hypothetical protein